MTKTIILLVAKKQVSANECFSLIALGKEPRSLSMIQPKLKSSQNWYFRKNGSIKGPFPKGIISNFVLIGRLKLEDEVSSDQQHWSKIIENKQLIPQEMLSVKTAADKERLLLARRREDERSKDRREIPGLSSSTNRREKDRRKMEEAAFVKGRMTRKTLLDQGVYRKKYTGPVLLLVLLIMGVSGMLVYLGDQDQVKLTQKINCTAMPNPNVNWSNCSLEGKKFALVNLSGSLIRNAILTGVDFHGSNLSNSILSYSNLSMANLSYTDLSSTVLIGTGLRNADLTNSRLTNADLSYANLRGARIGGAILKGAKLDRAIWIDGTLCALGSIGVCKR